MGETSTGGTTDAASESELSSSSSEIGMTVGNSGEPGVDSRRFRACPLELEIGAPGRLRGLPRGGMAREVGRYRNCVLLSGFYILETEDQRCMLRLWLIYGN